MQNEYTELAGECVVTFPIKEDALASMICRTRRKSTLVHEQDNRAGYRRSHASQGQFEQIVEEIKQRQKESSLAGESVAENALKVLLADDDVFSNLTLKTMIERTGKYQALACFNGLEALDTYKEQREGLAVIILDIEMPFMNGIDVAANVRQIERLKGCPRIPIIGLTGHESPEVKQAAISAGMSVVLSKPVRNEEIIAVLHNLTTKSDSPS